MAITQEQLDALFPPERSDAFFEGIYGDAEEGAYTIRLRMDSEGENSMVLSFVLHRRPGKCLVCQLTHGLPYVFRRHPVIDAAGVAKAIASLAGWAPDTVQWEIGETIQKSKDEHLIPLLLTRKDN